MLNTLANHGFLPHSGKDITEQDIVKSFDVLNFDPEFSKFLHNIALRGNPAPNATTFSLHHLDDHKKFEHDASLRFVKSIVVPSTQVEIKSYCVYSRADAYWGDGKSFNQSVFDQTKVYWTDSIVDLKSRSLW